VISDLGPTHFHLLLQFVCLLLLLAWASSWVGLRGASFFMMFHTICVVLLEGLREGCNLCPLAHSVFVLVVVGGGGGVDIVDVVVGAVTPSFQADC